MASGVSLAKSVLNPADVRMTRSLQLPLCTLSDTASETTDNEQHGLNGKNRHASTQGKSTEE